MPACLAILAAVMAFGLLLTGLLAGAVGADRRRDDNERVSAAAARVAQEVQHRMGAEVSSLHALRNEMMLDWPIDVASFHRRLDLHTAARASPVHQRDARAHRGARAGGGSGRAHRGARAGGGSGRAHRGAR
ncbi:MAG: hypothetical protein ABGZ36_22600, partial [Actinomycetota bacterium]